MSTTNREKRKQEKRKTRERGARARVRERADVSRRERRQAARRRPRCPACKKRVRGVDPTIVLEPFRGGRPRAGGVVTYHRWCGQAACRDVMEVADSYRLLVVRPDKADAPAAEPDTPLYIRFGAAPAGYASDRWDGTREEGLSVFRGYRAHDGGYVVYAKNERLLEMYKVLVREGRRVYLATGSEIARGADDEPLLEAFELTPLPAGSRVRCESPAEHALAMSYVGYELKGIRLASWLWEPTPEIEANSVPGVPSPPKDARGIVDAALASYRGDGEMLHGPEHWRLVAAAGARLLDRTPGADPLVVFAFSVLHDSARIFEGHDQWHGWRAATFARGLFGGGELLSEGQLEVLANALEHHDEGETSEDPTTGVCWDADRLNLWRIGVEPDPELLSTEAARDSETITWARSLQDEACSWDGVIELYGMQTAKGARCRRA